MRRRGGARCLDLLGREVSTYGCSYRVRGVVVGETFGTFLLLSGVGVVSVPKAVCRFFLWDVGVLVWGRWLVGYRDRRLFNCGVF